mgnify:FL=1
MPINTIDGRSFAVDNEGFFVDHDEWDEELAAILAPLLGIAELTEAHLAPLRFMRGDFAKTGTTPTLRRMQSAGGVSIGELFVLFPGQPAKKMAYLAGLPKPVGCL